jgi:hypothetical protein
LKGEEIPLSARIFAVHRCVGRPALRPSLPQSLEWKTDVVKYITNLKGKQFDPLVVDAFKKMLEDRSQTNFLPAEKRRGKRKQKRKKQKGRMKIAASFSICFVLLHTHKAPLTNLQYARMRKGSIAALEHFPIQPHSLFDRSVDALCSCSLPVSPQG